MAFYLSPSIAFPVTRYYYFAKYATLAQMDESSSWRIGQKAAIRFMQNKKMIDIEVLEYARQNLTYVEAFDRNAWSR
jgi:hypothetical protein